MNNKSPQITFVFDRKKQASLTVKSSVDMRITYNYQQKFLSTGIKLLSTQWKNGKIINCPDVIQISQTLDKLLTDVRQILFDMMKEGNIDLQAIPIRQKRKDVKETNFLKFCESRCAIRKYGKRKDTQERYDRFQRLFKSWGGIIEFEDINEKTIISYDEFLMKSGMKPYSKWNNYHRFLNSFIMDAIDAGYLKRNPYRWINIEKCKDSEGISRYLTPEEFRKVKTLKMPTESLTRVRDVFVFQTYTCLSYSDLASFDSKSIKDIKGMKVYQGHRQKTGGEFTIPLLSPAWNILNKYEGKLPVISNPKYNEYLKVVAQVAGIDKPLSTHWARHTGATLLINEGVDLKIIRKICGHSSIKMTEQIYAKLFDETVVDAVADLEI